MSHKIYSWHGNPRGNIVRMAADLAKVDYEFVSLSFEELKGEEFKQIHALQKVPVVETPEGTLFETLAILRYFGRKAGIMGTNQYEEAQINQWLDFISSEMGQSFAVILLQTLGRMPFDEAAYKQARAALYAKLQTINDHLNHNSYLVGHQVSAADIFLGTYLYYLMNFVVDQGYLKGHAAIGRYYRLIAGQPFFKKFYRKAFTLQTPWFNVKADKPAAAPKKEKQQPKKAEKKAEPKKEKKEEAPVIPKKAKNPLEELPQSPFNLFDFKTYIVNEKDRVKGVQEFWKQFDPQGYSIWHVKYDKYEGEGVKLFLTSNFKDSFLQRLDHFRKYVFGTYGVYGDEGCYDIQGIWVWRGTEIPQEIKDLPNYEYHFWTRLDHTKEEDRNRLQEYWTGLENDVSKADGQVARDVHYFK